MKKREKMGRVSKLVYMGMIFLTLSGMMTGCGSQPVPRYRGYHFDATIGGARVIRLEDPKRIPALRGYVRDVKWQLDHPIKGYDVAKIQLIENPNTLKSIGMLKKLDALEVIPLQYVDLKTDSRLFKDNSVQVGGRASVSQSDVLKENYLPPGDYIFRLKVHGTRNWDRKEIYVQVR
jgi:hypothetical protein